MKPFRALGLRADDWPKPRREVHELEDLSTFSARKSGGVPYIAVCIAPPRSFWTPLSGPVAGRLVTGSLPPEHRARFLLRLPKAWNGALVVSAAPGFTDEHAYDLYWSDFLIDKGYAFACTDKGVHTTVDGDASFVPMDGTTGPRHWLPRFQQLTATAAQESAERYGRPPERTYAVGISNGAYLVRRLMEQSPTLLQGGIDVSGVLWRPERNLLVCLPAALRACAGPEPDRAALKTAGFPADPGWDAALDLYRKNFWLASLALFLADLDPGYEGAPEDYELARRPAEVRAAVASICNTGRIERPLVSLAGRRDFLITAADHAEAYRELVAAQGGAARHSLVLVDGATHLDSDRALIAAAQPLMPHAQRAFLDLVAKVEGRAPVH
jgi:alpha-beta hydrolase superfamily lysophospholipase